MAKRRTKPAPPLGDDSFVNCPVCGLVFDYREMDQVIEHAHGRPLTECNKGLTWSEEALDDLREMLAAGDTVEFVAEFLCRPLSEARAMAEEKGWLLNASANLPRNWLSPD